jgi:hypothetical protein
MWDIYSDTQMTPEEYQDEIRHAVRYLPNQRLGDSPDD